MAAKPDRNLLSISAFARLSGLSVTTLRYYDQLGLLTPQTVTESRYRYYHYRQLREAYLISQLRLRGVPLERITGHLRDPERLLGVFHDRLQQLDEDIRRLHALRHGLRRLRGQPLPPEPEELRVARVDARPVAQITYTSSLDEVETQRERVRLALLAHSERQAVSFTGPLICLYPPRPRFGPEHPFSHERFEVIAALPVERPVQHFEHIEAGYTPAGTAVSAVHRGLYEHIPATHHVMLALAAEHGLPPDPGRYWHVEVFERAAWDGLRPHEFVTRLSWVLPDSPD